MTTKAPNWKDFAPRVLVAIAVALISTSVAHAQRERSKPRPWEWERQGCDVAVDSSLRFGHLDNGLRYAWKANPEPDQRSYIRLHVDVGSLAETESERGMAHFLEHLAFNGSENFEAGTLIEWFQKHGMSFGADTNAMTGFSETIYMIDLPTSDEETLAEGLQVLRDFAGRLLLAGEEVDAEKGVIDGEEREGDSAMRRVFEEMLRRMYGGTRYPERLPIGTKKARDAFTAESVRSFYRAWYRPENMTLILVGDFEAFDPTALVRKEFGDFAPPQGAPLVEPSIGKPTLADRFFFLSENELPTLQIAISKLRPCVDEGDSIAMRRRDVALDYARSMVNLRFAELAKEEGAPFLAAMIDTATQLDVFEGESLTIICAPDRWEEAIEVCEQELRRALEFGFQPAELEELRANALRSLDEGVEREATRSSASYVNALLAATEERYVPNDAKTRREINAPAIRALTVESCKKALVASWNNGKLAITGMGNLDLGPEGGQKLREAYEASMKTSVSAGEEIAESAWAYDSTKSEAGAIKGRGKAEDLGLEMIEFENGVRLNLKKTDFKKNQILVSGLLGEGRLTLPNDRHVLAAVADSVLGEAGLAAHDSETIRRLTAGKVVSVGLGTGEDHFTVSGGTTAKDLQLQFELMCATLNAPGWREDGLVQFRRFIPRSYEALEHQHQGPLVREFLPALYSNDVRYRYPKLEEMTAVGMESIREWLEPHLASAPLEVTLVGDLDVEATVKLAAKTLGRLPKRRAAKEYEERRKVPAIKTGLRSEHSIDTEVPKSLVLVVFPIDDGIETERRRTQSFLSQVVNDRLRVEVRERLGVAYSPFAMAQPSTVYPGDGLLLMQVMSDPAKTDEVVAACLDVAKSLAEKGATEEEVNRLKEPVLAQIRDAARSNGYWLNALGEAQSRPETLDDARGLLAFYKGLAPVKISELCKKFLKPERASVLIVNPEKQASVPADSPK